MTFSTSYKGKTRSQNRLLTSVLFSPQPKAPLHFVGTVNFFPGQKKIFFALKDYTTTLQTKMYDIIQFGDTDFSILNF